MKKVDNLIEDLEITNQICCSDDAKLVSSAIIHAGDQIVDMLAYIGTNLGKIVERMEDTDA